MRTVGNYEILEQLGEGAMGAVYRAVDVHLDRIVALKSVRREVARQPQFIERFREEAKIQARLESPHIVRVYQFLQEGDEYFMAMEFVNGYSLAKLLHDQGRVAPEQAVALLIQTLDGLHYAHERNVVHRDVKPANIMVSEEGIVKVADFGIARVLGSSRQRLTQVGGVVGTLEYMSPETLMGEDATAASDVYSCGIVAYQLLSGFLPFKHDNDWALVEMHRNQPPAPLTDLPKALEAAIMRALAKKPADRFSSAAAMSKALGAWLQANEGQTGRPTEAGLWEKLRSLSSPRPSAETGLGSLGGVSGGPTTDNRRREISAVSRKVGDLLAQQHWQEAQAELEKKLAQFGAETTLVELRGRIDREKKRYEEDLQRALQEAQTLLQRGLPDVAKNSLEAALHRFPNHAELTDLLRKAENDLATRAAGSTEVNKVATRVGELLQREQFQEAVRYIADAVGRLPNQPELITLLSHTVQAEREHARQKALDACRQRVQGFHANADWAKAFEAIDQSLAQYPGDPAFIELREATERERQAHLRAAEIQFILIQAEELKNRGQMDAVEELLLEGLTKFPEETALSQQLAALRSAKESARRRAVADAAIEQARELREKSEWNNALGVLAKALKDAPEDAALIAFGLETKQLRDAHLARLRAAVENGEALLKAGRLEDALMALSEASQLYPEDPAILKLLRETQQKLAADRRERQLQEISSKAADLLAKSAFDEAEQLLLDAIPQFPDDARLTRSLSSAIQGRREQEKKRFVTKCLERAESLRGQNNLADAIQELDGGLSKYPEDASLQKQRREFSAALRDERRSAQLSALRQQVDGLLSAHKFDAALSAISQASREYPGDAEFTALETKTRDAQRTYDRERAETETAARVAELEKLGQFDEAWKSVQVKFALYPESKRLAELRDGIDQKRKAATRKSSEQQTSGAVAKSIAARQWPGAEALVAEFEKQYGKDAFSAALREQIAAASKARTAEVKEVFRKAIELNKQADYSGALDLVGNAGLDDSEAVAFQQIREKAQAGLQEQRVGTELKQLGESVSAALQKGSVADAKKALSNASPEIRALAGFGELEKKVRREETVLAAIRDASGLLAARSWAKAAELLGGAVRTLGDDPRLGELAARVQREQQEHEQAIQSALAEARSLCDAEQYEQAVERLNKAIAQMPNEAALERALTETRQRTPAFRRAAKLTSIETAAKSLLSSGQAERAEAILQEALGDLPGEPALLELLQTAQTTRQRDDAVKNFAKNVQLHLDANDPEHASEILREALQAFPDDQVLLGLRVTVALAQAVRLLDLDTPKAALRIVEALPQPARNELSVRQLGDKCRKKIQEQEDELKQALAKAKGLVEKEQCDEALAVLAATPAELQDDPRLPEARKRAETAGAALQQATAELAEVRKLLKSAGPEAALKKLEQVGSATRRRPEFAALQKECQVELKKWQAATRVVEAESLRAPEPIAAPGKPAVKPAVTPDKPTDKATDKPTQKPAVAPAPPTRAVETKKPLPWKLIAGGAVALAAAAGVAIMMMKPSAEKPKPPASTVSVEIRTDPQGATVKVGDQSCQTPNCTLTLAPGSYQLQAELNGFESASKPFTIATGKTNDVVDVSLRPVQAPTTTPDPTVATGTLVVQTGLEAVLVYVDGQPRDRTDTSGKLTLTLDTEAHKVRVEKPGYGKSPEQTVKVASGKSLIRTFKLSAEMARLDLKGAPAGVDVRVNGALLGRTDGAPVFSRPVSPIGEQTVQVTEGTASKQLVQRFDPGQSVVIDWANIAPPKATIATPPPIVSTNVTPVVPTVVTPIIPAKDPSEQEWEKLRNSTDVAEVEAFLNKYPSSPKAGEARTLRDRLQQEATARLKQAEDKRLADAAQAAAAKLTADRTAILSSLKEWADAMNARNMTRLTAIYPSFASTKSVADLLSSRDVLSVTYDLKPKGEPQIMGDTARWAVDRTLTVKYRQQQAPPARTDTPTVTFARKPQGWVIDGVK